MVGKAAKRTGFDDHLNRVESKMQSYYVDAGSESSDASLLAARAKEQEFLSRLPGDLYIENALFDEEREVCDVSWAHMVTTFFEICSPEFHPWIGM